MKKTMRFLSMAALALMGAMMTGCSSSDDSIADIPQQPENTSKKTVTLTTTVGLDAGATTRALTGEGVKTFAVGETMAVIYYNGTSTVKAVSHALEAGDITNEGKNATFTFDLETPNKSASVLYIYPAAMAGDTGVDFTKLKTQEGTFDALQSKYDLCTNFGAWDGDNLPSLTLENRLAILAITLKDEAGTSDITSSITGLTLSDGTKTYNVNRSAVAGPIYVAIFPTADATITVTATNGTLEYTKTLTSKTYDANNGYSVSWKMDLPVLDIETYEETTYTVTEDMVITGSRDGFAIYTDGSHEITLDNVNGEIYLEFNSPMTIKLKGENRLLKISCYPQVTIDDAGDGDGTLIVIAEDNAIYLTPEGGGDEGTLIINGGTVKAKVTLIDYAVTGNLIVNGGAVYLKGVYNEDFHGFPAIYENLTVNGGNVYIAGGDGARAVQGDIDGKAKLYGWDENDGWSQFGAEQYNMYNYQYITTDENSGYPTDSKWTW